MPIFRRITNPPRPPVSGSSFGARVRAMRKARGMTGSEFARRVGVTPTAVWNWETNGTQPRSKVLSKIAAVLGVSESFLIYGTDANPASASRIVPEVVEDARNKIALAMGMAPTQVHIRVELITG